MLLCVQLLHAFETAERAALQADEEYRNSIKAVRAGREAYEVAISRLLMVRQPFPNESYLLAFCFYVVVLLPACCYRALLIRRTCTAMEHAEKVSPPCARTTAAQPQPSERR